MPSSITDEQLLDIISSDHVHKLRKLLAAKLDANRTDEYEMTLLHHAASADARACLRELLKAGADINHLDWMGCSALHHAAMAHHTEAIRILLEAGADPTIRDHDGGCLPLDYARGSRAKESRALLMAALQDWGIIIDTKPVMQVSEIRRKLHRRAVILHSRAADATPEMGESCLGRVTRQLPGESRPQDSKGAPLIPLATLFIRDMPVIPPALEGVAVITIFTPQDLWEEYDTPNHGSVVRAYASTEGFEICNYTATDIRPCQLIPEPVENDMPTFPDSGGGEEMWGIIRKVERALGIEYGEEIIEADYRTHKIGGYPTYAQDAPELPEDYAFVLQIRTDAAAELNIADCGCYYFYYNPRKNDWRVHVDFD